MVSLAWQSSISLSFLPGVLLFGFFSLTPSCRSGARPDQLAAVPRPGEGEEPEPDYSWDRDLPDDALWKKSEPNYDWAGATPDAPFDRPRDMPATEPLSALDEDDEILNSQPDDLSEYTEEEDDEPKPVTGVPCAAWTFLALGVVAGGLANVTAPATVMAAPTTGESLFGNNPNAPTATDKMFPSGLAPCANDAACQAVMKGLGPNMPPSYLALMDIPGTCQSKARDWLRTGKDVLEFQSERIRQRYAITVFFCETDGGDWLENDMWLSDLHECDWYNRLGLDPCNRVEQMEVLRIHDNGLQGTLAPELSILSSLYELTLSDNMITGTFPSDYSSLSELDTFVLAFNQFEGPMPGFIFRYPDMVYWDIAYNRFTGSLPDNIPSTMPDLQVMMMENNEIGGTIPANLGSLNLRRVMMDDNQLTGTIPTELGQPPRLKQLYLHGNQLEGGIPTELANLPNLEAATFHFNNLGNKNGLSSDVGGSGTNKAEVSKEMCNNMYQKRLSTISVDCDMIACECCTCGEPDI